MDSGRFNSGIHSPTLSRTKVGLPTEAELQHACRADGNAPFGFGGLELANDYGWFNSSGNECRTPSNEYRIAKWRADSFGFRNSLIEIRY